MAGYPDGACTSLELHDGVTEEVCGGSCQQPVGCKIEE